MKRCVFPGSFDPPTLGHLELAERASALFDELVVAVLRNPGKKSAFTPEERVDMLRRITTHLPNVRVESFSGLLADYVSLTGACAILRGVRAGSDFAGELSSARLNRQLNPKADTVVLVSSPELCAISSSSVKEIASFGGKITGMVPPCLEDEIVARFAPCKED